MKTTLVKFICILSVSLLAGTAAVSAHYVSQYNVVWNSQSKNVGDSMPLGGGDIGCNVWVENNDILLYLSRSGTFDENNSMLKMGRVRIHMPGHLFSNRFNQELNLEDGSIRITGDHISFKLWVEVFRPIVHVESESTTAHDWTVSFESWRTSDHLLTTGERSQCFGYANTSPDKIPAFTRADNFLPENSGILWYHQNRNDELITDREFIHQHLGDYVNRLYNPLRNLVFGGMMTGDNLSFLGTHEGDYMGTPFKAWNYQCERSKRHHLDILLQVDNEPEISKWEKQVRMMANEAAPTDKLWQKNQQWWKDFWNRSHIIINSDNKESKEWKMARNYQLFRYQLACNAYGQWPTKFNGGLFCFDPAALDGKYAGTYTPDYRRWGGGSFTAQNQRLVYWPMLKAGDFDMMRSQFDFYNRALSNAELRTKVYWGHWGASFTEQVNNNAIPAGHGYEKYWGGTSLPIQVRTDKASTRTVVNLKGDTLRFVDHGTIMNPWIIDHYDGQLEFAKMMLDYHCYTGNDITEYIPFIASSLRFFDEHYQFWSQRLNGQPLDDNGKLVIYPSTALETYKEATNASCTVAALQSVLDQLLNNTTLGTPSQRKYWKELRMRVPAMPFRIRNGKKMISPAERFRQRVINNELPQLYAVYPYHLYGLGLPDLQVAIDTWHEGADSKDQYANANSPWNQDAIFAANLGLTEEAKNLLAMKLCDAKRFRFPTFWLEGDWGPDHNWGGVGMIALQEMLLQTVGDRILLFPAWPSDWDVDFKLHADRQTTIEASLKNGKIISLKVTPESRQKDLVLPDNI